MLKSDPSFWNNWKDFSENKNCFNIEILDDHTGMGKHTIERKFLMRKSLTMYNFLKMKSQM